MKNSEFNLLTIKLNQDLYKEINKSRCRGFKKEGNPTFKIFDECLIVGIFKDDKLPSTIEYPKSIIEIDKRVRLESSILHYGLTDELDLLSSSLISVEDEFFLSSFKDNIYFPIKTFVRNNLFPMIYLASDYKMNPSSYNLKTPYCINDIRLELLKINSTELGITWSLIDYRHLQKDTV
jgi:hypothetical protein